jgi:LysM repeat protein
MRSASDLAAWWEKNRRESDKALDDFVDAHPNLWVLAATTATAMDLGAGMVDVLRFGEGAAESYETGKIAPLLHDVLRGVSIASQSGTVLQKARPLVGRLKLYSDPGGGLCVPISIGNALRRTGQRFLLSLQEIGQASGVPFQQIWKTGLTDPQMLSALRKLGVKFTVVQQAQSLQHLTTIARATKGVVSLPLSSASGGHMALLENVGGKLRIVDRSGFYKSLADLSKHYGTKFTVDAAGAAVVLRDVTAGMLGKVATLMIAADGLTVKLDNNTTLPTLDAKFTEFKQSRPSGAAGATGGAGASVVVASGDTLSALARKHYGSVEYWPLLWDANRTTVGPNPNRIAPGMRLTVPPLRSFTQQQLADARQRFSSWRTF